MFFQMLMEFPFASHSNGPMTTFLEEKKSILFIF